MKSVDEETNKEGNDAEEDEYSDDNEEDNAMGIELQDINDI